jgi:glycosyltransferase involved in cell wall biosynthesis
MKLRLFMGAYNAGDGLLSTLEGLLHLYTLLKAMQVDLEVLLIDDASTDETYNTINQCTFTQDSPWLATHRNKQHQGHALVVMHGYAWALEGADNDTLVACCETDGSHEPLEIAICLWRHLRSGHVDSVVGTINYPDHLVSAADYASMRMLGELQTLAAGATEPFYVNSPGFQIHRAPVLRPVIENRLPRYVQFYTNFRDGQLPSWGIHGVILHLLGANGARIRTAYLGCYGQAPSRSPEMLATRVSGELRHLNVVREFLALPGSL